MQESTFDRQSYVSIVTLTPSFMNSASFSGAFVNIVVPGVPQPPPSPAPPATPSPTENDDGGESGTNNIIIIAAGAGAGGLGLLGGCAYFLCICAGKKRKKRRVKDGDGTEERIDHAPQGVRALFGQENARLLPPLGFRHPMRLQGADVQRQKPVASSRLTMFQSAYKKEYQKHILRQERQRQQQQQQQQQRTARDSGGGGVVGEMRSLQLPTIYEERKKQQPAYTDPRYVQGQQQRQQQHGALRVYPLPPKQSPPSLGMSPETAKLFANARMNKGSFAGNPQGYPYHGTPIMAKGWGE